jgi:hypothetical protein
MKLSDLAAKQTPSAAVPRAGTTGQPPAAPQSSAPAGDAALRKAAAEVLRIFDTGVGNAGITPSDWLMAMAELRAALGQPAS